MIINVQDVGLIRIDAQYLAYAYLFVHNRGSMEKQGKPGVSWDARKNGTLGKFDYECIRGLFKKFVSWL